MFDSNGWAFCFVSSGIAKWKKERNVAVREVRWEAVKSRHNKQHDEGFLKFLFGISPLIIHPTMDHEWPMAASKARWIQNIVCIIKQGICVVLMRLLMLLFMWISQYAGVESTLLGTQKSKTPSELCGGASQHPGAPHWAPHSLLTWSDLIWCRFFTLPLWFAPPYETNKHGSNSGRASSCPSMSCPSITCQEVKERVKHCQSWCRVFQIRARATSRIDSRLTTYRLIESKNLGCFVGCCPSDEIASRWRVLIEEGKEFIIL
jgi:hypothetical protein